MTASNHSGQILRFGAFELDLSSAELRKFGTRIKIQEKPFQILALLTEQPGELVTREQLRERLWPADTFVDFDQSLNSAMKKLRQALNDSANAPRFVETQARKGYRFIAPVQTQSTRPVTPSTEAAISSVPVEAVSPPPGDSAEVFGERKHSWLHPWQAVAGAGLLCLAAGVVFWQQHGAKWGGKNTAAPVRINSVAVLPLADLTPDSSGAYFADGLTDALIASLAQVRALRVISRTSVMQFRDTHKLLPEIARELQVNAVLEGTVQRQSHHVRITAKLVDAATDRSLWAETYERDLKDILGLENEIAAAIASKIQIELSPEEREQLASSRELDPEAYEDFLKGRFFWNKRTAPDMQQAVSYLQKAIARDPSYARAYAGLADCYNMMSYYGGARPKDSFPRAKAAAIKALQIDQRLAEAHAALAFNLLHFDWDWSRAEAEFKKALALNPGYANTHHWYSHYLLATGRFPESLGEAHEALLLDPLNLSISTHLGHHYIYTGKYDMAAQQLQKALELNPASGRAHLLLGEAYRYSGKHTQAASEFAKAFSLAPEDPQVLGALGRMAAKAGHHGEAQEQIEHLTRLASSKETGFYQIATIYAALGNAESAFSALDKAYRQRSEDLIYVKVDPDVASLRADPRFDALVRHMRLPR